MSATPPKTKEQHAEFAKQMAAGAPIRQAMILAGWSERQARKGQRAISKPMLKAMAAQGMKLADLSKALTTEEKAHIAQGRLINNCITGTDKGAQSAKILGSHRDINLWTPDSQVGVIVLNAPQYAIDHKADLLQDLDEQAT